MAARPDEAASLLRTVRRLEVAFALLAGGVAAVAFLLAPITPATRDAGLVGVLLPIAQALGAPRLLLAARLRQSSVVLAMLSGRVLIVAG